MLSASVHDTTDRIEAETQLRLYQSAINASDSAVSIADMQQTDMPLIYVNEGFRNITGYSVEETIGRNCRFLQGDQTDRQIVDSLRTALQNSTATRVTLLNYRKDDTPFWNDLSISPDSRRLG